MSIRAPSLSLPPLALPPLASMALAMLLVGASAPLGELALRGLPLFVVLAARLALAGAALSLYRPDAGSAHPRTLTTGEWGVLAFQALCGVVVFNVGLWLGMAQSGPAAAGIFTSATPAVMTVLGVIALGERPAPRALAGVGLTVLGVLAARGAGGGDWTPRASDAWLCAAVAGEAVFLLALKRLPPWLGAFGAARRVTWLGFALVLPLGAYQALGMLGAGLGAGIGMGMGTGAGAGWGGMTAWLAVAALGVLVTAGGYVLWFAGVARARASQAAAVAGLLPVGALASAWLLLGQAPGPLEAVGCLAVGVGIVLAAR